MTAKTFQQADSFEITDLEQVKILADPLRLKILTQLASGERTTKQVAQRLGEKPTRLYHHVEALERVGLIHLTRTRRNRGTVEKYYVAVARCFRAAPQLFGGGAADGASADDLDSVTSTLFRQTAGEVADLLALGSDRLEDEGLLTFAEVHASAATMARFRRRLEGLLTELQQDDDDGDGDDTRRFRLTLAFFPLDAEPSDKRESG